MNSKEKVYHEVLDILSMKRTKEFDDFFSQYFNRVSYLEKTSSGIFIKPFYKLWLKYKEFEQNPSEVLVDIHKSKGTYISIVTSHSEYFFSSLTNFLEKNLYSFFHAIAISQVCKENKALCIQILFDEQINTAEIVEHIPCIEGICKKIDHNHGVMSSYIEDKIMPLLTNKENKNNFQSLIEKFDIYGIRTFSLQQNEKLTKNDIYVKEELGILEDSNIQTINNMQEFFQSCHNLKDFLHDREEIIILKSSSTSPLNSRKKMDLISVSLQISTNPNFAAYDIHIAGMFKREIYSLPLEQIPIISQKICYVYEKLKKNDYLCASNLCSTINLYPRDEIFQIKKEDLLEKILQLLPSGSIFNECKIITREDIYKRYISVIVVIPKEPFRSSIRKQIGSTIAAAYSGQVSAFYPFFGQENLVRVLYIIKKNSNCSSTADIEKLRKKIQLIATGWDFQLHSLARKKKILPFLEEITHIDSAYKYRFTPEQAIMDLFVLMKIINGTRKNIVHVTKQKNSSDLLSIHIYSEEKQIFLSDIMNFLSLSTEYVLSSESYSFIHLLPFRRRFLIKIVTVRASYKSLNAIKNFENLFQVFLEKKCEEDELNKLVLLCDKTWEEINILRGILTYIGQRNPSSPPITKKDIVNDPDIATFILDVFFVLFDPNMRLSLDERENLFSRKKEEFFSTNHNFAKKKKTWDETFIKVIKSITRTSFFDASLPRDTISFKIKNQNPNQDSEFSPFAEIFVYSYAFEGIHIRMAKIARGGIRWSERSDYRNEVIDLVKAQQLKNAVIVPEGAKGAFFIKSYDKNKSKIQNGQNVYRKFILYLLTITDNKCEPHLKNIIKWDEEDAYLVVAPDKGTASFSDIGNQISHEVSFWLKDAFASGGCTGYDHKKLGITARGAWESAKRHCKCIEKNPERDTIRVVGIGDMSGDVFGNGMLLSKTIKLVAAFDHRHIFLDPNPCPKESFYERKRLFSFSSSWRDYSSNVLSKGGMIIERTGIDLPNLSKEILEMLSEEKGIKDENSLIRSILSMPCDLIWFGGIGVFVKASDESNDQIGDHINAQIRINASDIRSKIVVEGANLAVTQRGRIEFSHNSGLIFMDALDNSGGVDCSDHEVNIKILLDGPLSRDEITKEERDLILRNIEKDICKKVLEHNYRHALSVQTASNNLSIKNKIYLWIRDVLIKKGYLSVSSDKDKIGGALHDMILTGPEMFTILSSVKMYVKSQIGKYCSLKGTYYDNVLKQYFPKECHTFIQDIHSHPLRREIISTSLSNFISDQCEIVHFFILQEFCQKKFCSIMKIYLTAISLAYLYPSLSFIKEKEDCLTKKQIDDFITKTSKTFTFALYNVLFAMELSEEYKNMPIEDASLVHKNEWKSSAQITSEEDYIDTTERKIIAFRSTLYRKYLSLKNEGGIEEYLDNIQNSLSVQNIRRIIDNIETRNHWNAIMCYRINLLFLKIEKNYLILSDHYDYDRQKIHFILERDLHNSFTYYHYNEHEIAQIVFCQLDILHQKTKEQISCIKN